MNPKILLAGGIVLLALVVALTASRGAEQVEAVEVAQAVGPSLMQLKLDQAKTLLEALALEDYERIGTASEELKDISIRAQWTQPHSQAFGIYGDEFRTALSRMGDNALEKNLDGVTLNFMQMVASCVECHEVVREGTSIAAAPSDTRDPLATLIARAQFSR